MIYQHSSLQSRPLNTYY